MTMRHAAAVIFAAFVSLALNNARNVQTELGKDNVQIEIVAYGPGDALC